MAFKIFFAYSIDEGIQIVQAHSKFARLLTESCKMSIKAKSKSGCKCFVFKKIKKLQTRIESKVVEPGFKILQESRKVLNSRKLIFNKFNNCEQRMCQIIHNIILKPRVFPFSLTKIAKREKWGAWMNIMKPMARPNICRTFFKILIFWAFSCNTKRITTRRLALHSDRGRPIEDTWGDSQLFFN